MNPLFRGLAFLVVFVVGLFFGHYATRFYTLEFKKELGLGDLINFAIAIIFAFVLQNYFQKRFGNERAEKDHIFDLIKEPIGFIKESRSIFIISYEKKRISKDDEKAIKALLRNLSNSIGLLRETLDHSKYSAEVVDCKTLETYYREYKEALTGRNFPTKPYDGDAFSDAEKYSGQAVSLLNRMHIKLNRK